MGVRCFKPGKSRVAGTPSQVRTLLTWVVALTPLLALGGCTGLVSGQNKAAESAVQVTPASVDFGSTGVGKTISHIATVTNSGTTTVTLTKASVSTNEFSISGLRFPISIMAGEKARFTVSFRGKRPGKVKGKLQFTGDPTVPDPVDLTGSAGSSAPKLDISAASHDFGKVTVNTVANTKLTLSNSGAGDLNLSKITTTGATFAATGVNLPAVVPAGGTVTVNVAFSPKTAGNYTGTVAIASDDPATPNATVSLTGVGTAVDVGKLTATPASLSFSNVKVGSSATTVTTLKNTGTANLTLSQISTGTAVYSTSGISAPTVIAPGDSLTLSVKFAPTAAGTKSDSVSLVNSQGGITSVSLSGTALGSSLTVSPGNISFGNVVTNLTNSQTVQITNPSTTGVKVSAANITGTGFSTSGLNLPLTLNAGQSSTFNVQFNPKTAAASSGTLTLVSDATTSPAPIGLSGTGIAAGLTLSVNPSSVSFGNVSVNATASKNVTVTNTGNSSVAISSVTLTGAQFALTGGSAVTLTPSQSIALTVQFGPTAAGAESGTLTIVSNATGSPATVAVSGSGVAAPVQHTVALSWNASSSATGYNVYRSVTSGAGYSKLNSSLDNGLSYSDSTVQNGQSYFYVTTAVDGAGNESPFSTEVSVNIP
jgi:Abnormal spindle-like microcephaly-assoc'd, ASPM-SPD-2-Hydin